ncbi:hypothetical protein FAUST_4543 [Fusarium austroamericanum]|uniref:BTB domain-containing protein n=1 Tax=Fusarium austroamericanum TaxID=282268 RepID=A0AAN6HGW1_FUSAU|nr:hypothetical protein FAUST_4543 [Fusarium austroamericanum]
MCPVNGPSDQGIPFCQLARYAWSNLNLGLIQPLKQDADHPLTKNSDRQVVEDLVPGGDLVLAVGPGRRLFGVSSNFLCEISPVFAVMFGPNFEEGHRLRSTQPEDSEMVLELPDDNAQAFSDTIRVLYGADPVTVDFEPAEIQKIAIVVDKYDMIPRFTFASAYWFAKYSWTDDPEETWQLTTAAYWMQNPDAFFNYSKKLIRHMQPSHLSFVDDMPDKVLGLRLCLAIEEQRAHRLTHGTKAKGGLCLHCFSRSKVSFTLRIKGCKHRKYHY